jgi:ABC-2 type transport system permease protein
MNRFLTLIRRDFADHKGAIFWTPVFVVAALIFFGGLALLGGQGAGNFGPDGIPFSSNDGPTDGEGNRQFEFNGTNVQLDGNFTAQERTAAREAITYGTAFAMAAPLVLAAIVIIFTLLGALYEERKDRSILFWKSMPVSDAETVSSKLLTITVGGFGMAFIVGLGAHCILMLLGFAAANTSAAVGLPGLDTLSLMVSTWGAVLLAVVVYLLWALPVYAWLLFASAASPKAPIVLGIVPLIALPIITGIFGFGVGYASEPLNRLAGGSLLKGEAVHTEMARSSDLPFQETISTLLNSLLQPGMWIGLLVAGALVVAASEVRRRKAL